MLWIYLSGFDVLLSPEIAKSRTSGRQNAAFYKIYSTPWASLGQK